MMRDRSPGPLDPAEVLTVPQVIQGAKERLTPDVWDYLRGGAESEVTLRRNRLALDSLAFRPRVLRDVREMTVTTSFLDIPLELPVLLAPIGSIAQFDPDGALACARAAERAGTAAFVGSHGSPSLEEVSAGSAAPLFFQVYVSGERSQTLEMVNRATDAGYRGICLTVDGAAYGRRERDIVNGFSPTMREKPNLTSEILRNPQLEQWHRSGTTWEDIAWLTEATDLPVMLKGIGCGEDAELAVQHGVDVVYLSNHGGRQLDHSAATIDVLPEVVAAVGGSAQVLVDSGFIRGTDVLKALALGADGVVIGKLMAWALAAGGSPVLARTLELIKEEMLASMANIGVSSVHELRPEHLRPAPPVLSMTYEDSGAAGPI